MKATKQNIFDKNTLDLCGNADGVLRFDEKNSLIQYYYLQTLKKRFNFC